MDTLKRKTRKRRLDADVQDTEPQTKRKTKKRHSDQEGQEQQQLYISHVEFKFLLSDQQTAVEGLEKFIEAAKAVADGLPVSDIVAGYCQSSPACSELFAFMNPVGPKVKVNELTLVFRCLELILTRVRTTLIKLSSAGEAIVQKLLAGHMGQVYSCLQERNKSKTIKACLHLLTSMVLLSDRAKKAVQSRLNFAHVNFPPIFRRRNRKDTSDVRSCAVMLTLAFLQDSDLGTVSFLVQQKTFLQQVIGGLKYDRRELVLEVLATLLDKVVTFPGLTKTDKVKLFSETVLKQLCELYDWQGPSGWVPPGKKRRKDDDEPRVIPEGFVQDQEMVANVAHEFLLELCCSHKHGLNFYDKSLGTGLRAHNQLLAHLIDWLAKKMDAPKVADLMIEILCACPDLMKAVLTNLCPSLTPRWSDKWRQLMRWVTTLYSKLPDIPQFLAGTDFLKEEPAMVVSKATVFCVPPAGVAAVLAQGIKHEDLRVRDLSAQLLQVLASQACAVLGTLSQHVTVAAATTAASVGSDSILDAYSTAVMKSLPPASLLFVCVDKTMQLMRAGQQTVSQAKTPSVMEAEGVASSSVDLSKHTSVLLRVLGLYQTLVPSLLSERPKDLAKLVDLVGLLQGLHQAPARDEVPGQLTDDDTNDNNDGDNKTNRQTWLPQLFLLKLLSDTDVRNISLGREGLMEKLLLSANQSEKVRDLTKGLICKMLESMEIFSGHGAELHTWLAVAMDESHNILPGKKVETSKATLKSISFLARCLATLINNPSPYVDRVMEAVAEAGRADTSEYLDIDYASVGTSESSIEAVLLMDDEELDSKLDNCLPLTSHAQLDVIHLPLSPLCVVALDHLHFGKSASCDADANYVSKVLVHLLHSHLHPAILARVVTKSEAKLAAGVRAYLKYWTGEQPSEKSVTQPLAANIFGKFTSTLMSEHFGLESSSKSAKLAKQIKGMSNEIRLSALRQVLLYVSDMLRSTRQSGNSLETLNNYLHVASSLVEDISTEDQKSASDNSSWIQAFMGTSDDAVNDSQEMSWDTQVDLAVLRVLFSQFVSSSSTSANAFAGVLLNPVLKSWLFKSAPDVGDCGKKSPKRKDRLAHVVSVSESVSGFVSNIITLARHSSWLKSESGLVEEYTKTILDGLSSQRLSTRLEDICGQMLDSLSPLLNLRTLSKCVGQILEIPLSSFIDDKSGDTKHARSNADMPLCRALCQLVKHLRVSLETDPSLVGQRQLAKLLCPVNELSIHSAEYLSHGHKSLGTSPTSFTQSFELEKQFSMPPGNTLFVVNNQMLSRFLSPTKRNLQAKLKSAHCQDGCILEGSIQIQTTFQFEDSSGTKASSFSPVFSLLPHCENEHLTEFAIFAINHIPEIRSFIEPDLFDELFKNPLTLVEDSQPGRLFASLVKNVQGYFEMYEQWLVKHIGAVFKRDRWFLLTSYLQADSVFTDGRSQALEVVTRKACSYLKTLDADKLSQSLSCWKLLALAVCGRDPEFHKLLVDTLVSHVRRRESCQPLHFSVLAISSSFYQPGPTKAGSGGQSSQALLLNLILDYLSFLIVEGGPGSRDLEKYIVDLALYLVPQLVTSDWTSLLPPWEQLTQQVLRHRLMDTETLKLVSNLAEGLLHLSSCGPADDSQVPENIMARHLVEQCVRHPMFLVVMTSAELTSVKDELVKLLHVAGELNPSCYSNTQLGSVLSSAYSASLSLTDQRLLLMMKRCNWSRGAIFECPVLWGKSATEHQSVSESLGPSLYKEPTPQVILGQLDPVLMQRSILNFPVRRSHLSDPVIEAREFKSTPECYDPNYLLRLFRQILSPDKQVPLRSFVEKDCLSYLLIALSSHDQCTRLQAYHALNDFYVHAEGARWHEKMEVTFVLDLLAASRVKDGQKLSFIVALFFARAVRLLLLPADPLYVPVFRFLMAKPEFDLSSVPEFYKLFFSAETQYKQERNWMLTLLRDGCRETSDYWLFQKKFVFKIIFAFYDSAISDAHSQELVLQIVKKACQEKSVAVDLVKNQGLMPWLVAAVSSLDKRPEHAGHLCDIIHTLWHSLTSTRYLPQPRSSSRPGKLVAEASDTVHDMSQETIDSDEDEKNNKVASGQRQGVVGQEALPGTGAHADRQDNQHLSSQNIRDGQINVSGGGGNLPRIPRSTAVEMALLVTSLIGHLSKTNHESLAKIMHVLYSMTCHDHKMQMIHECPTHLSLNSDLQYLSLSPLDSCLLLYHVATTVGQPAVADAAAAILKNKGVNFQWKARKVDRKPATDVKLVVAKEDPCAVTDLDEEGTESVEQSSRQVEESAAAEIAISENVATSLITDEGKRCLFQMLLEVISGSIEFR